MEGGKRGMEGVMKWDGGREGGGREGGRRDGGRRDGGRRDGGRRDGGREDEGGGCGPGPHRYSSSCVGTLFSWCLHYVGSLLCPCFVSSLSCRHPVLSSSHVHHLSWACRVVVMVVVVWWYGHGVHEVNDNDER